VVIGFGECSVDEVLVVPELPHSSASKLPISSSSRTYGGQVATCMAACAALGLPAAYLGPVGDDEHGDALLNVLRERGVDVSRTIVRRAPTRRAVIMVEESTGDRLVLWERDPALDITPEEFPDDILNGASVLHVDATDERASIYLAGRGRAAGATVTCDIDRVTSRTWDLLGNVTHPILAASVPSGLTNVDDVRGSLSAMRERHKGILCVTLGDRGAAVLDGDRFVEIATFGVRAIDTTGAGDVFRAGFIYGLLQSWPIEQTVRLANAAAAASCTHPGAIASVPSLDDVLALVNTA
jgi:sugar/nucleoside kinase (ribokinase family)